MSDRQNSRPCQLGYPQGGVQQTVQHAIHNAVQHAVFNAVDDVVQDIVQDDHGTPGGNRRYYRTNPTDEAEQPQQTDNYLVCRPAVAPGRKHRKTCRSSGQQGQCLRRSLQVNRSGPHWCDGQSWGGNIWGVSRKPGVKDMAYWDPVFDPSLTLEEIADIYRQRNWPPEEEEEEEEKEKDNSPEGDPGDWSYWPYWPYGYYNPYSGPGGPGGPRGPGGPGGAGGPGGPGGPAGPWWTGSLHVYPGRYIDEGSGSKGSKAGSTSKASSGKSGSKAPPNGSKGSKESKGSKADSNKSKAHSEGKSSAGKKPPSPTPWYTDGSWERLSPRELLRREDMLIHGQMSGAYGNGNTPLPTISSPSDLARNMAPEYPDVDIPDIYDLYDWEALAMRRDISDTASGRSRPGSSQYSMAQYGDVAYSDWSGYRYAGTLGNGSPSKGGYHERHKGKTRHGHGQGHGQGHGYGYGHGHGHGSSKKGRSLLGKLGLW